MPGTADFFLSQMALRLGGAAVPADSATSSRQAEGKIHDVTDSRREPTSTGTGRAKGFLNGLVPVLGLHIATKGIQTSALLQRVEGTDAQQINTRNSLAKAAVVRRLLSLLITLFELQTHTRERRLLLLTNGFAIRWGIRARRFCKEVHLRVRSVQVTHRVGWRTYFHWHTQRTEAPQQAYSSPWL